MPEASEASLTERQRKWFASIRDGLERETGRNLEAWVEIARACPETKHRARLTWMKQHHGLGQNRASYVLNEAFPPDAGWSTPDKLEATVWADPASGALLDAVRRVVLGLEGVLVGQRKSFTAFSRGFQFAAIRPDKGGGVVLGLAVPPESSPRLVPTKRESWSERLKSSVRLRAAAEIDDDLTQLLRRAWETSA